MDILPNVSSPLKLFSKARFSGDLLAQDGESAAILVGAWVPLIYSGLKECYQQAIKSVNRQCK